MEPLPEMFSVGFAFVFLALLAAAWGTFVLCGREKHALAIGLLAATAAGLTCAVFGAVTFAVQNNPALGFATTGRTVLPSLVRTLVPLLLPPVAGLGLFIALYRVFFPMRFGRHLSELAAYAGGLFAVALLSFLLNKNGDPGVLLALPLPVLCLGSALFSVRFFASELGGKTLFRRVSPSAVKVFGGVAAAFLVLLVMAARGS